MSDADSLDPGHGPSTGSRGRPFARRRRNRHGRGLRGALMLQQLPGSRTRAERFEDLVAGSAERLEELWGPRIAAVAFEVELVPSEKSLRRAESSGGPVPLGTASSATARRSAVIRVYRRPVEQLAGHAVDLGDVVHDVVVELVAELLAMAPEDVDSSYGRGLQGH
ncbi:metallopeptidase family protein [Zafaria sp. Z1313]|uniref:metallopeptidase family protein n=1 Tax=unclassified Zafaria TaxID=2828765 RepID=UPI002E78216F|nr:metallopeptidase family protein [Zafaria sp. J156]MEE1619949.1 metallopeptidase family protein [Zafaria sp. J156]